MRQYSRTALVISTLTTVKGKILEEAESGLHTWHQATTILESHNSNIEAE